MSGWLSWIKILYSVIIGMSLKIYYAGYFGANGKDRL